MKQNYLQNGHKNPLITKAKRHWNHSYTLPTDQKFIFSNEKVYKSQKNLVQKPSVRSRRMTALAQNASRSKKRRCASVSVRRGVEGWMMFRCGTTKRSTSRQAAGGQRRHLRHHDVMMTSSSTSSCVCWPRSASSSLPSFSPSTFASVTTGSVPHVTR